MEGLLRLSLSPPVLAGEEHTQDAEPFRIAPGKGEHILYLDDDEDLAFAIERILPRLGYRCTAFTDAVAALNAFRANSDAFDAVITDLAMPSISGLEVARALHAIRPSLPIALTTALWDGNSRVLVEAGIRAMIAKPAGMDELSRALHDLLATETR